jgi:hypothetical protein
LRELRLMVRDARSEVVRRRVTAEIAGLSVDDERDALRWIEADSGFDADDAR